jgi:hemerythrin superfamily protein
MNALELLKFDHETVNKMFSSLLLTSSADKAKREEMFGALKDALIRHAHAEEKVFYPPLREKEESHDIVEEGINEHHVMEDRLNKIAAIPMDSDDWLDAVESLKECVQHHVREEEGEIFPKAQRLLGDDELERMAGRLETAKKQEGPIH